MKYQLIHRNKLIVPKEMTMDALADMLESMAVRLREMGDRGVTMSPSSGDDYYFFETEDPKVAAAFGMTAVPEEETTGDGSPYPPAMPPEQDNNSDDAFRRTIEHWDDD